MGRIIIWRKKIVSWLKKSDVNCGNRAIEDVGGDAVVDKEVVVIEHAGLSASTIMSKMLARPNVKLFNVVAAEDLFVKELKVGAW